MINIMIALTVHHVALIPLNILHIDNSIYMYLPPEFCSMHTILVVYFGTVLMFLFAAEAIHLFLKIVLVFSEIICKPLCKSMLAFLVSECIDSRNYDGDIAIQRTENTQQPIIMRTSFMSCNHN